MGHHESYEIPPDLPLFGGGKKTHRLSNSGGDGVTVVEMVKEAATAIAATLKPQQAPVEQRTTNTTVSIIRKFHSMYS
jgi:hypothetical protein